MKPLCLLLAVLLCTGVRAQITDPAATEFYEPVPPKVQASAVTTPPPADAIVLFGPDGSTKEWAMVDGGGPVEWTVEGGVLTVKPGTGFIKTRRDFGDVQLHLEWRSPDEPDKEGQNRGNSGVFFQERYEVQVLESHGSYSPREEVARRPYGVIVDLSLVVDTEEYAAIHLATEDGQTWLLLFSALHPRPRKKNQLEINGRTYEWEGVHHLIKLN